MSGKEQYHSSQADRIRRYLSGELNASEMHALEKEALDDPFLADAIEGMQSQHSGQLGADITDLQNRIHKRIEGKEIRMPVSVILMRVAAAVVILTLIGVAGIYIFSNKDNEKQIIAEVKSQEEKTPPLPADTSVAEDTTETIAVEKTSSGTQPSEIKIIAGKKAAEPIIIPPANASETKADTLLAPDVNNDIATAAIDHTLPVTKEKEPQPVPEVKVSRALSGKVSGVDANRSFAPAGNHNVFFYNGQVRDLNNQPVSFANITIKNSNSTTYADAKGNFRLIAADSMLNIDVRSVGFAAHSAVLTFREPNPVLLLKPEQNALSEVVVTGKSKKSKPFAEIKSTYKDSLSDEGMPVAEPVDGWGAYHLYLLNNVRMQKDASGKKVDGMVTISFNVSESGWLSAFKVEKSLNALADKEAIRLIKEGPKWELYNTEKPLRTMVTVIF